MKNLSLHTPSLLAGFGLAALVGLTMSQTIIGAPGVEVRVVEVPELRFAETKTRTETMFIPTPPQDGSFALVGTYTLKLGERIPAAALDDGKIRASVQTEGDPAYDQPTGNPAAAVILSTLGAPTDGSWGTVFAEHPKEVSTSATTGPKLDLEVGDTIYVFGRTPNLNNPPTTWTGELSIILDLVE